MAAIAFNAKSPGGRYEILIARLLPGIMTDSHMWDWPNRGELSHADLDRELNNQGLRRSDLCPLQLESLGLLCDSDEPTRPVTKAKQEPAMTVAATTSTVTTKWVNANGFEVGIEIHPDGRYWIRGLYDEQMQHAKVYLYKDQLKGILKLATEVLLEGS